MDILTKGGMPVLTLVILGIVSTNRPVHGFLEKVSDAPFITTHIKAEMSSETTNFVTPPTVASWEDSSTQPDQVCQDRVDTCSHYGRAPCTTKVYEAWAKFHCALYCGFCTPNISSGNPGDCINKVPNCPEFDDGSLCTEPSYSSWAYENCKAYCKLGQCNDTCMDQTGFDCSALNISSNMCNDTQKAKSVCRQFCGLCDLVDGGWSVWSSWGECDVSCGNGSHTRQRQCKNPAPAHGGLDCQGNVIETHSCTKDPCPVHGSWSSWTAWDSCSVSCGQGFRRRDRYCNNPYPSSQGDHCFGSTIDIKSCTETCFGNWSTWSGWSLCSKTCESLRFRDRDCSATVSVQQYPLCVGSNVETEECNCTVRLVGGTNRYNGRLELLHNGTWGSVCNDDSFTNTTASVVCNMLSLPSAGAFFKTEIVPAPPNTIWLDDIVCFGNESDMNDCSQSSWDNSNCSHGDVVSIYCSRSQTTPVRLVGDLRIVGGKYKGRLEVFHDGLWGTVCDDGFTNKAARVICRMLNFGSDYANFTSHYSTNTASKIWLDETSCSGTELDIADCGHDVWGNADCDHTEDVFINCSPPNLHSFTATRPIAGPAMNSVTFSTIVSSVGSDYNTSTGTFTCSSPGTYYFTVSLTKTSGDGAQYVHCFLRLNGGNMILINMNSGMYFASVSGTFHLVIGDEIDISNCSGVKYLDSSTSVFTGYQVNID